MTSATGISTEMWWIITTVAGLAIGTIIYFLKRTMNKVDSHDKDITDIKLTYVTKTELNELKGDVAGGIEKLEKDVSGIKDKYLTKDDFYRTQAATDKKLDRMQAITDQKLDRLYDLLLKISQKGGNDIG